MFRRLLLLGVLAWAPCGVAWAQGGATTVQLPTFQFFTVDTTVWVPDGGTTALGGMGRGGAASSAAGTPFGPLNRATATGGGASQVSVSAKIHDMQALDAAVLSQAKGGKSATGGPTSADRPPVGTPPAASVAEAKRQHADELAAEQREAAECLAKGRRCEAEGKIGAARIYYQQAARRAEGDLKEQALARLDALPRASRAAVKVAEKP